MSLSSFFFFFFKGNSHVGLESTLAEYELILTCLQRFYFHRTAHSQVLAFRTSVSFEGIHFNPQQGLKGRGLISNGSKRNSHCKGFKSISQRPRPMEEWLMNKEGVPGGSRRKGSACQCGRSRFYLWVAKIPWRREWLPTPVFLPGEFYGLRSLVGLSPWGGKESDMTEHTQDE